MPPKQLVAMVPPPDDIVSCAVYRESHPGSDGLIPSRQAARLYKRSYPCNGICPNVCNG
ncbi:MAG: hypothetical protein WDN67_04710 [Candidatus Moraniibacteriota bacterium]